MRHIILEQYILCFVLYRQERELVLKRIAEDRKTLQEKNQTSSVKEASPPSSQGQKLGGKVQTNVDNNCILMVRLWGTSTSGYVNDKQSDHRLFLCCATDSAAIRWVNAWTLPSWSPSAQRRGAHHQTLPLPTFLFPTSGFPTEALWGGRVCLLAALSGPHTQCCTVYSNHSSRDTSGSTESCRTAVSRTQWATSMFGATASSCPCPGGGRRAGPSTSSSTQSAMGRGGELCRDP